MTDQQIHIEHLCVRSVRERGLALRLALSSLLGTMDWHPPGLPPSAVLIVQHLSDPLPGHLAPHRNPVRVDVDWERAVQQRLAETYRRAARPVQGRLPTNTEAVAFADRSEMLACLSLDLARDEAGQRWWWRVPLRRLAAGPAPERLGALLCDQAACVPAAFHLLTTWKQAAPVLRALSPTRATVVLQAVCAAFGVSGLENGAAPVHAVGDEAWQEVHAEDPPTAYPLPESRGAPGDRVRSPWTGYLAADAVPSGLGRTQACLMGVSLMLYRTPARVRQTSFRRALQQWQAQDDGRTFTSLPEAEMQQSRRPVEVQPTRAELPASAEALREAPHSPARPQAGPPETASVRQQPALSPLISPPLPRTPRTHSPHAAPERPEDAPRQTIARREAGTESTPAEPQEEVEKKTAPGALSVRPAPEAEGPGHADEPSPSPPEAAKAFEEPEAARVNQQAGIPFEAVVVSHLGGAFYLLNLMTHLGLPDCFEETWGLAGEVGPWGVLEVLARALLPPDRTALTQDPLWRALAVLDGREPGTLPGTKARDIDRYTLPAEWLVQRSPATENGYCWAAHAGRLRVWSAEGYPVAALPRDAAAPSAQARAVLEALGVPPDRSLSRCAFNRMPLEDLSGPFAEGFNPSLARGMAIVLPYLRYRLGRALGLAPADRDELAETLLLHTGSIYFTASHVDLVLPLDAVSIPVRMAGLDRDPGWLPAFGRVVLFHFE